MSELEKTYDPKIVEKKWYQFWEDGGYFKANPKSDKPTYSFVMPPPNVTGALHMGHALVGTLQDILIRYKRMSGFETLWLPGTDHAGISTQTVVERQLYLKTGKRRRDFSREEFLKHVWEWKESYQEKIVSQIKELGCSCDWSRLRFTMDDKANKAVKTTFKKMFDDGLIYRGNYLVNWDPITQTAIADDEVEHEERDSFLWHFRYPLVDDEKQTITIATTRPETMLGDVAVAVAPKDPRYKQFIGKFLRLPFVDRHIPVIEDSYVDKDFGTGAVKITPAHDHNDYEIGQRHDLEMINIMNPDGTLNENGGIFAGLSMLDAREEVVKRLNQEGLLVKTEPHKLRVGISYKSKAVVEPYLSKQWFIRMQPFKDKLIDAVEKKKVKLTPSYWEKTYFHWIHNLRDWCISRQLWWGHRIPIWYDKDDPEKMICYAGDDEPEEVVKNPGQYIQDEDVLDTWFSSALWPFSTLGWPEKTNDLEAFFPHSTLITGHDILFFWVARMIMMAEYTEKEVPFKEAFIHGLIFAKSYWREDEEKNISYVPQDERIQYETGTTPPKDVMHKWEKMSKSKGNVIDPIEIIDAYGTDAMRFALCFSVTDARQIDLDRRRFEEFKNFANKLWNATRFIFLNLDASDKADLPALTVQDIQNGIRENLFSLDDRWILSRLGQALANISISIEHYDYDEAAKKAYTFLWDEFCAYYLEMSKPYLFGKVGTSEMRTNKQLLLASILMNIIRLIHPIAPFITEEIFSRLKERFPITQVAGKGLNLYSEDFIKALQAEACIVSPFPKQVDKHLVSQAVEDDFAILAEVVHGIRNLRAEMQIPPSTATEVFLTPLEGSHLLHLVKENEAMVASLAPIASFHYQSPDENAFCSNTVVKEVTISLPLPKDLLEKEKNRLHKEIEKLEKNISSTKGRLNNPAFIDKAPKELVDKTKKQLAEMQAMIEEFRGKQSLLSNK